MRPPWRNASASTSFFRRSSMASMRAASMPEYSIMFLSGRTSSRRTNGRPLMYTTGSSRMLTHSACTRLLALGEVDPDTKRSTPMMPSTVGMPTPKIGIDRMRRKLGAPSMTCDTRGLSMPGKLSSLRMVKGPSTAPLRDATTSIIALLEPSWRWPSAPTTDSSRRTCSSSAAMEFRLSRRCRMDRSSVRESIQSGKDSCAGAPGSNAELSR
mmetsp:Transcript_21158/g.63360  ORF Transcript_21158/g.63360 Transcript_21158/m.63360 type:complete len:212 (+) Transcript_21158:2759-3394(+)